jgi:predicted PurR-regulated permease PerM
MTESPPSPVRQVPVRTILAVIGLVLATVVLLWMVVQAQRVLVWLVIAAFFAVALDPAVSWVERRVFGGRRRALATLIVFVVVVLVLIGIIAAFAVPLAREGTRFAGQLPDLIDQTKRGEGVVGRLLERTHVLNYIQEHQDQLKSAASGLTTPAVGILRGFATGIVGALTVFVVAYLMVLEKPKIVTGVLALFPPRRADRIARVSGDCAKSVNGYIVGNVAISVICGLLTFAVLAVMGVPFAGLLALFVAIADLIPLVGATLGAVIATVAAFIHSVPAGITAVFFFIVYQQLENHLLQPVVFSRTVKLNPLTVIVAILIAAELAGILGALLAIPLASMIQVIARDVWDHRRGRPKPEPTVGEQQVPVTTSVVTDGRTG